MLEDNLRNCFATPPSKSSSAPQLIPFNPRARFCLDMQKHTKTTPGGSAMCPWPKAASHLPDSTSLGFANGGGK